MAPEYGLMPSPTTGSSFIYSSLTGDNLIDALISGVQWEPPTLTYSFPSFTASWSTAEDDGYPDGTEPWTAGYGALSPGDMSAVQKALTSWANVADLQFAQVADNASVVGDLRFAYATLPSDYQAWAYYPFGGASSGDVWFNANSSSYDNEWNAGSYEYLAAIHEIGHALGLKHPFDDDWLTSAVLPAELDTTSYTVMSYSSYAGDLGSYLTYEPTTPMVLDIAAIQALYGANTSFNSGDTTYNFIQSGSYHMTIWDAGGTDTIAYASATGGAIDLRPGLDGGSNLGKQVYAIDSGNHSHAIDNIWIAYGAIIENATGGSGDDTLIGNDADNTLTGNAGSDSFAGGAGNDTYVIDRASEIASLTENSDEGTDTVVAAFSGAAVVLDLSLLPDLENIRISGDGEFTLLGNDYDNTLLGNAAATTIHGGAGNDTLDGKAGADTMDGGTGNDLYFVDNILDVIVEGVAEGNDSIQLSIAKAGLTYTLGDNVENAIVTSTATMNLVGNSQNNDLQGNAAANRLEGGAGTDTLTGGAGKDTYVVDAGDTIVETSTLDKEIDSVLSSATWTLGDNLENLTLLESADIDATGNALKNTLTGNGGSNWLDGGLAADKLIGGLGNDTYVVDLTATNRLEDKLTEAAGAGNDTLVLRGGNAAQTTFATLTLGANLEVLDASDTASTLLNLKGNALDNTLIGNDANNALSGGAGNDTLIGGIGADTLTGGAGADLFCFDVPLVAGGRDLVKDFTHGLDSLQLDDGIFVALSIGTLADSQFVAGPSAIDADDFIIYNSSNGILYYDSDGSGAASALEIAQIGGTSHPQLLAADIHIV
jgi:serralysin